METKKNVLYSLILAITFLFWAFVSCWAEEETPATDTFCLHDFVIHGFFRYEPSLHFGVMNPNNKPLQRDNNTWNLSRSWLQIEPEGKLGENIRFYGKIRVFNESAEDIDNDLANFNAFPQPFSGNDLMLRSGRKHYAAEVWELFTDVNINRANLWLRIGKQTIAWGEPIAIRVFDCINALDLSWHGFFEPAFEEFDNTRIPIWAVRAIHKVPISFFEDVNLEWIVSPKSFPQILPALGSPYNLVPSYVKIYEDMPDNGVLYAGKATFIFKNGLNLQLMVVSKPAEEATAIWRNYAVAPDSKLGIPVFAPGNWTLFRLLTQGEHPRVNIVGASADYFLRNLGGIVRAEATCTLNQPYQVAPYGATLDDRSTWKILLAVDRNLKFWPTQDSAMFSLSFFERYISGDRHRILINNVPIPTNNHEEASLYFSQPIKQMGGKKLPLGGTFYADLLLVYDFDDARWLQPGVRYDFGDHWRFNLFANIFDGNKKGLLPGRYGALSWGNEIFARITYGF